MTHPATFRLILVENTPKRGAGATSINDSTQMTKSQTKTTNFRANYSRISTRVLFF